jgi:hypothetical protein
MKYDIMNLSRILNVTHPPCFAKKIHPPESTFHPMKVEPADLNVKGPSPLYLVLISLSKLKRYEDVCQA